MATELRKITQLAWRRFLLTEEGKEGMLILHEKIPSVTKGSSEDIIFAAGVAQGHKDCLGNIAELLAKKEDKEVDASND